MASPPAPPDCILSLRDGTLLAVASSQLKVLLAESRFVQQSYSLPVYKIDEDPKAVRLLYSLCSDTVDPMDGPMPSLDTLLCLARLCVKTGHADFCRSHIIFWTDRWMVSSLQNLPADVLRIALICRDKRLIMEVFRAFLFAKVTSSEIQAADNLLPSLPTDRKLCGVKFRCPI